MNDERKQIKAQRDNWNKQRTIEKNLENLGIEPCDDSNKQDYLAQLTLKLAERAFGQPVKSNQNKNNTILEQKVCKEVEANTCAVCYELMVPPDYSPILLFPCGHTFCKTCTVDKNNFKKLKITKCPLCRQVIGSHAVNISLQNLICIFSNQRHLLDQASEVQKQALAEQQDDDSTDYVNLHRMFKMRCEILLDERKGIVKSIDNFCDEMETHSQIIETLKQQRDDMITKMQRMENQLNKVNSVLEQNLERVEDLRSEMRVANEKKTLIDQTLKPLQGEMQKYQILCEK